MAQMGRPGLSPEGKAEVWRRWRSGESFLGIGKALGKPAGSIYGVIRLCGGYAPPVRKRSPQALTLSEREEISRGVCAGHSIRAIARQLSRAPSTISREIARNGGTGHYRALEADERASQPHHAYVLANRRGTRLKVLVCDGFGIWLAVRRLHQGSVHWPRSGDTQMELAAEQARALVIGLPWQRLGEYESIVVL